MSGTASAVTNHKLDRRGRGRFDEQIKTRQQKTRNKAGGGEYHFFSKIDFGSISGRFL
jgi:hypothetical protein